MRWTEEQLATYNQRQNALDTIAVENGLTPKPSKHRNHKVKVGDMTFDSKREYQRWTELEMMQKAGKISQLQRQVVYVLVPAVILDGRKKPAVKYIADFVYFQHGEFVVEDAKSPHLRKDPYYRLKKHLLKYVHQLDLCEI